MWLRAGAFQSGPRVVRCFRASHTPFSSTAAVADVATATRNFLSPMAVGSETANATVAHVVDCGSGCTRIVRFTEGATAAGLQREKLTSRGARLSDALPEAEKAEALVNFLAEQIPSGPLLVGATAGVRGALASGAVSEVQLGAFAELLRGRLGERARIAVLTGEEEAHAEWEATLHALCGDSGSNVLGGTAPLVALAPGECAGMISGGGMSCQLARRTESQAPPQIISFENHVLEPGGLCDRSYVGKLNVLELLEGLKQFAAATTSALQGLPRLLRGTYAAIEWVGFYIADHRPPKDLCLNMGHKRLLPQPEVLAALDRHLSELLPDGDDESALVERPVVVALVYGTLIRALLTEVFSEDACFYCLTGVDWTTGHYLLSKCKGQ